MLSKHRRSAANITFYKTGYSTISTGYCNDIGYYIGNLIIDVQRDHDTYCPANTSKEGHHHDPAVHASIINNRVYACV